MEKKLKICPKGHRYYKSTDCPTCPKCEAAKRPRSGFLSQLSNPARRALEAEGITSLRKLSQYSDKEILALHGMGPASIPVLKKCLEEQNLSFATGAKSRAIGKTIGDYINARPEPVRGMLKDIKTVIERTVPDAQASISYGMPAYKFKGKPLAYFAANKNHIGFYGTPVTHKDFEKELSGYKQGKGSVQFPVDKKMPLSLIGKMVKCRATQISDSDKKK